MISDNPDHPSMVADSGTANGQAQEGGRPKRTPPSKTLPSDRLAAERQLEALRAFAVVFESNGGKPVTNDAAGSIIGMSGNTVVATNAFLCDMKLLFRQKEEQAFMPSAEAVAYHKAFEWDKTTAGEKLRPVFERAWFAEALVPRLKFRPYDQREALVVLAEASNAAKEYEGRLEVLLELMVIAGVVVRDGSLIKAPSPRMPENPAPEAPRPEPVPEKRETPVPEEGHEQYTLVLDPKTKRRVVVTAPHVITRKELERITKWLEFQLIVEDNDAQKL